VENDDEPTYVVEDILDHRLKEGSMEYLVKWKGWDEPTWNKEEDFIDTGVIDKYLRTAIKSVDKRIKNGNGRRGK
jgi:hypothetical protein